MSFDLIMFVANIYRAPHIDVNEDTSSDDER